MTVNQVVVGVDGSELSLRAVRWAAELASQAGATLTVVHGFEPLAYLGKVEPPVDFEAIERETNERLSGAWVAGLADLGVECRTRLVEADPVSALCDVAEDIGADLIVIGTRGMGGFKGLVLGSVAQKLPHRTARPVTIIPPT